MKRNVVVAVVLHGMKEETFNFYSAHNQLTTIIIVSQRLSLTFTLCQIVTD